MTRIHISEKGYSVLLFVVAAIWGTGFIATQIAIDAGFSSQFIMLVRFSLAAMIFGIAFRKCLSAMQRTDLVGGFLCGALLFSSFFLQTVGLKYCTPANNAFITATNIILVPFLSWIVFRMYPQRKAFIGAILCFAGVWILSWQSSDTAVLFGKGELLTLGGAVCFAFHTVCLGYFARNIDTKKLNFVQLATAAVFSLLSFVIGDRDLTQFSPSKYHLAVLYLAVFSTCVAYFIQTTAQKHLPPSRVAVIIATESLFASVLSVVLGFEGIKLSLLLGGLLILSAVVVVETDWNVYKKGGL